MRKKPLFRFEVSQQTGVAITGVKGQYAVRADPDFGDRMADEKLEVLRRVQIGGVGLIAVLLMVSLASLVSSRVDEAGPPSTSDMADDNSNEVVSEPLVEFGAQPTIQPEENGAAADALARASPGNDGVLVPDLEPDPKLERARRQAR